MGDFFGFYREYAQTGVHAASAAALTAFGLLVQFHEAFAVVALLAYVVPLGYQYRQAGDENTSAEQTNERERADEGEQSIEGDILSSPTWEHVDVPTDATLFDAVTVAGTSTEPTVYAVGAGGVVLERASEEWNTVVEDGPGAAGNTLRGVDATDDGRAVWVAGDGGALGRLDVATGRQTDHSAPSDDTSTVTDVAVAGPDGREQLYLVNGSGQVRRGRYDGETVHWQSPVKPGSGSSIAAVEFADSSSESSESERRAYAVDTNGGVFQSAGDGEWESVGIDGAGALTAVAIDSGSEASPELVVTSDDGTLHRYDGAVWTPVRRSERALRGVALAGERRDVDTDGVAVGEGGTVLERIDSGWEPRESSTAASLAGVCLTAESGVAVGDDGTVLERSEE